MPSGPSLLNESDSVRTAPEVVPHPDPHIHRYAELRVFGPWTALTSDRLPCLVAKQIHRVAGVMPEQVIRPAARSGLQRFMLVRRKKRFARPPGGCFSSPLPDALVHPLIRRIEAAGWPTIHTSPVSFCQSIDGPSSRAARRPDFFDASTGLQAVASIRIEESPTACHRRAKFTSSGVPISSASRLRFSRRWASRAPWRSHGRSRWCGRTCGAWIPTASCGYRATSTG